MKIAYLLCSSLLLTCNTFAQIKVDAENMGSMLKLPAYYAIESAGWHTKIRITNTNTDTSIVAKLVLRESTYSLPQLDMLLYLAPTDVFDADIREVNGSVVLATVDDSHNLHVGDLEGRVSGNNEGEIAIKLKEEKEFSYDVNKYGGGYTEVNNRGNNNFGYIEVYGLMQNSNTEVPYSNVTCNIYDDVTFDREGNVVDSVVCLGQNEGSINLGEMGVNHDDFVKASLSNYEASKLSADGWRDVEGGLIGEAVILANNSNGHLAMAYQALAFSKTDINTSALSSDTLSAVAQRDVDTNLLMFNDASLIKSFEDEISKERVYVTFYSKDGALAKAIDREDWKEGNIAETQLLANFVTKKYSTEYALLTDSIPYPTYGINYAGGNLFNVESASNFEVRNRNMVIVGYSHDNYEAHVHPYGVNYIDNLGIPSQTRIDHNDLISIDLRNDTPFSDGYLEYYFLGRQQRDTANNKAVVSAMPYIPLVMSAVTFSDGVNVTNIKYPASLAKKITRMGEVSFYSEANATAYDVSEKEDGLMK